MQNEDAQYRNIKEADVLLRHNESLNSRLHLFFGGSIVLGYPFKPKAATCMQHRIHLARARGGKRMQIDGLWSLNSYQACIRN